jgi:predicted RNase H-like nuclease (RuvC/YqgF family)
MDKNVSEIKNEVEELQDSISDYVASGNIVEWKKKEIEELQNQLPETCPLCGGKL